MQSAALLSGKGPGTQNDHGAGELKSKKPARIGTMLCVNVYGPRDMTEAVGEFFSDCGMYLQDLIHCDRDVAYCNPHLLYNDEEQSPHFRLHALLPLQIFNRLGRSQICSSS